MGGQCYGSKGQLVFYLTILVEAEKPSHYISFPGSYNFVKRKLFGLSLSLILVLFQFFDFIDNNLL